MLAVEDSREIERFINSNIPRPFVSAFPSASAWANRCIMARSPRRATRSVGSSNSLARAACMRFNAGSEASVKWPWARVRSVAPRATASQA